MFNSCRAPKRVGYERLLFKFSKRCLLKDGKFSLSGIDQEWQGES